MKDVKKEVLTIHCIKSDLQKIADSTISNAGDWRFSYIIPFTLLAILIGVCLGSIVVGVLIFSVAAYHIVQYCIAVREYKAQKKALQSTLDRGDVSISVKTLSHIKAETIYEPHAVGKHRKEFRTCLNTTYGARTIVSARRGWIIFLFRETSFSIFPYKGIIMLPISIHVSFLSWMKP